MLIYKQIPLVMGDIGIIAKSGKNPQGWPFRKIDDIKDSLNPSLVKHGVYILPEVLEWKEERFSSKHGNSQMRVFAKVKYKIGAGDGSFLEATTIGEGVDTSDKAAAKAMTAAYKTMLDEVFCIALNTPEADADQYERNDGHGDTRDSSPEDAILNGLNGDLTAIGTYRIKMGKLSGKMLSEVAPKELNSYIAWLKDGSKKSKKPLVGAALELVENGSVYLNMLEAKDLNEAVEARNGPSYEDF